MRGCVLEIYTEAGQGLRLFKEGEVSLEEPSPSSADSQDMCPWGWAGLCPLERSVSGSVC